MDAFLVAFKGFDEAGDNSRLRVLKYLLMASMLHASEINPLDSPEARPYKDAGEIVIMTKLVGYFHDNEIGLFEGVLRRNEGGIMDDEFVASYMDDLLNTVPVRSVRVHATLPWRDSLAATPRAWAAGGARRWRWRGH